MDRAERRRTLLRAALAGGAGGLVLGVADFLPSVLYLHQVSDRLWLAARLAVALPALGALLAMGLVGLDRLARPLLRRSGHPRALAPLPVLAVVAPALVALTVAATAGGQVSRLPHRWLLVAVAALALITLGYGALRGVRLALRWRGRRAWAAACVLIGAALALTVANRLLYPRHYDALHGALTAAAWASAALGGWMLAARGAVTLAPAPWRLVTLSALALTVTLATLMADHDGRAALLSPRASSARSVMLAAAPLMYAWSSTANVAAVDAARRRRQPVAALDGAPRWPEAHLVLVTIDALRADHLGAYGYGRRVRGRSLTPTLDALAAEGVLFERAWTPTPRSSYAICSLMTGLALLPRGATRHPTLAEELGRAGFYTAAFYNDGIFFHEGERLAEYRDAQLGFERRDAEYRDAASRTDAALAELEDLRRRGEPRTFLWVHYFDAHEPYEERALGDAPMDRYDGEIRNVDRALARLLAGVASLSRDVILVLSADHGEEFLDHGGRFHGASLYEEQLRVPLIVRAPGLTSRRVATPVSLLDVAPTLRGMLALGASESDGYDLRPLLVGRALERAPLRANEDGMAAVLRWPHKLIEDVSVGTVQLFDLRADPAERAGLASERGDLVEALRAELAAFD